MLSYIDRLNKIMHERELGRSDARKGVAAQDDRTEDYYVAYSEEYQRQQIADHWSEQQCK